jgi:hypothetical protein
VQLSKQSCGTTSVGKSSEHLLKVFNCGLSDLKQVSVSAALSADVHAIWKYKQDHKQCNRCMQSDQQPTKSSGTYVLPSGINVLITNSISGMDLYSVL